ncbi:MAG: WG repeat-containing protein [Muribaculaceae bacterium]|nr:WG repeat-containing protein [Muribaculaceae bacterium]
MFLAKKGIKSGIIDINNNIIIPFDYEYIQPIGNDVYSVKKNGRIFRINIKNELIDEIKSERIEKSLNDGFKKIRENGKWGILDPKGKIIVDFKYDEISTFRGRLVGIINKDLIKLDAYYPYRLPMSGFNKGIQFNKDIIEIGGYLFENFEKRKSPKFGDEVSVILINWTSQMQYPSVLLAEKAKLKKKSKHFDKSTDFEIGKTYSGTVTSPKTAKKRFSVTLDNGEKTVVFPSDLKQSNISISKGDKIKLTKIGYNEELDRTIWKVSKL